MAPSSLIRRMTVSSSSWVQLTGRIKCFTEIPIISQRLAGPTLVGEILRPLSHPDDGQGGRNAAGPQPLRLSAQRSVSAAATGAPFQSSAIKVYLPITDS